jgi:hypothetical protein
MKFNLVRPAHETFRAYVRQQILASEQGVEWSAA